MVVVVISVFIIFLAFTLIVSMAIRSELNSPKEHEGKLIIQNSGPQDDGRRVNGHKVVTEKDWQMWNARKEDSDEIYYEMANIEKKMMRQTTRDPEGLPDQWWVMYDRYRKICLEYGMWNKVLGDCRPFTASPQQLKLQALLPERIRSEFAHGEKLRAEHKEFLRLKREAKLQKSKENI